MINTAAAPFGVAAVAFLKESSDRQASNIAVPLHGGRVFSPEKTEGIHVCHVQVRQSDAHIDTV